MPGALLRARFSASNPNRAMSRSVFVSLILSAVAAGLSACGDSNAPAGPLHSYQLVSVDGAPLPVTVRTIVESSTLPGGPVVTCADKLMASSLRLMKTSQFTRTDSHLLVCEDGRPDAASQTTLQGTYAAAADTVVLTSDLGNGATYVGVARVNSDGVTIYRQTTITVSVRGTDATVLVFRNSAG
jgi:hypothetical protein